MLFPVNIGKDFPYLHNRIVYNFATQMSPFKPIDSENLTIESQQQYFDFLCSFYKTVNDHPELIGMKILPDETEDRTIDGRNYKEARIIINPEYIKLEQIFLNLMLCGQVGQLSEDTLIINKKKYKYNKTKLIKLEFLKNIGFDFNIDDVNIYLRNGSFPKMMSGVVYLACKCNEKQLYCLTRAIFDDDFVYQPDIFGELTSQSEIFKELFDYFKAHDFDVNKTGNEFKYESFKIVNGYKLSFICEFKERNYYQYRLIFTKDKNLIKKLLTHFNDLDGQMQELIVMLFRKCGFCGYCNQTNRKRPLVFVPVEYKGETINYCPYFQEISFGYLDGHVRDLLINFFEFMFDCENDKILCDEKALATI